MKALIWVERTACNNTCDYCIVFRRGIKQAEKTWQEWVEKINALKPSVLDITGGEPFLNPNLVDIIKALDPDIQLGLTTNLTRSILRFVNEIPARRLLSMTLSYHPSQKMSREAFTGKALLLKNRGYPINVNFVTYPEQLWLIEETRYHFEVSHGIRFHLDPYSQNPGYEHTYTEAETEAIKKHLTEDRQYRFKRPEASKVLCSAGNDYGILEPDGSLFRCMTLVWKPEGLIGNVFDPEFKLDAEPRPCDNFVNCAGCDMDKVTVKPIEEAKQEQA